MRLSLNNIPSDIFKVSAAENEGNQTRADIVQMGRLLAYEYARKGQNAVVTALNSGDKAEGTLDAKQYKELNEKFQAELMLYSAKQLSQFTGEPCPSNLDEFKRNGLNYYGNKHFYAILQGIFQEIVTPILPRVYSEAVSVFADVVEVGFGETAQISIDSNDIPIFQDSAWGASRSVPRNRFYAKDYTLNPQPKTAQINAKWHQLVGNNVDFGKFFANLTAGMYAKTMGMWQAAMTAAASNTALVPSGLTYAFSSINWVTLANKISAVNSTAIGNVIAYGAAVPLAKVLPTQATGSSNVNMDAALATLLGADYIRAGYLGEFMSVRLMPLVDAVVPGTQNSGVTTVLDNAKIWMMASNGRKPMTIAYNSATPITLEFDPMQTADFEIGINVTIALDSCALFSSKVGLVTI